MGLVGDGDRTGGGGGDGDGGDVDCVGDDDVFYFVV